MFFTFNFLQGAFIAIMNQEGDLLDSRPERLDKKAENVQKTKKTQRQRTVSYIVFYHSFISNDFSYFINVRKLSRVTERDIIGIKLITNTCHLNHQMRMNMVTQCIKYISQSGGLSVSVDMVSCIKILF